MRRGERTTAISRWDCLRAYSFLLFGCFAFGLGLYFPLRTAGRVFGVAGEHTLTQHGMHVLLGSIGSGLAFVVMGIVMAGVGMRVLRINRAQLLALSGDLRAPLAAEQPSPSAVIAELETSEPPPIIRLRPRWSRLFLLIVVTALTFEWIGISAALTSERPGQSIGYAVLLVTPALLLVLLPISALAMIFNARQTIEATQRGLTITTGDSKRAVAWDDVRLFAVYPPGRPGEQAICYGIFGAGVSMRWVRFRPAMPFLLLVPEMATAPAVPYEEYERHMEALLTYVAAKTNLPLHDLRRT